jgi:hypothetical protein
MVTNIKLNLTEAERERIALAMTGKPGRLATRKQITEYVLKLMQDDAKPTVPTFPATPGGSTEPRCLGASCAANGGGSSEPGLAPIR